MANNCLQTILKGIVDNDSLQVFNQLVIKMSSSGDIYMRLASVKAQNVLLISPSGDTIKTIALPEQSGAAYTEVQENISSYEYVLMVFPDKVSIAQLSVWAGYIAPSDAKYEKYKGDINFMPNLTDNSINGDYTNNKMYELPALQSLSVLDSTLNLENFSKCTNLYNQNFGSMSLSYVNGNLDKFLANMCKAGRVSGTYYLTLSANRGVLYFGGIGLGAGWAIAVAFDATGCTITRNSGSFPYASITYTTSTDSWA